LITHATLYGKIYWVTYNWDINKYTGVCLIIFSVAGEDLVCNCTNQKLLKLTDQAWSLSLVLPSAQNRPGDQAFFPFFLIDPVHLTSYSCMKEEDKHNTVLDIESNCSST